jgi:stage V sporulation protein R
VAHVLAHCDFFRNSAYFAGTNRQMVESASVHAERIRRYEFEHGSLAVERFLDAVLSIEEHVDPVAAGMPVRSGDAGSPDGEHKPSRRTTPYDDLLDLDSPPGQQDDPKGAGARTSASLVRPKKIPPEPERDLLQFLLTYADELEDWQRDVIAIVRQERLYFAPQMRTKILNEGWASLWHSRILRELDLPSDEYTEFARLHSSVAVPSRRTLNPYYVGMKLLEHVERRWDDPSKEDRDRLGLPGGEGRHKLFEIRELESDLSFIRNYLTKDVVEDLDLYIYEYQAGEWKVVEKRWENVRDQICRTLTSYGIPYITVEDGDHRRGRELYLKHHYDGDELDGRYAERTLQFLHQIWGRRVHLETVVDEKPTLFTCDGAKTTKAPL